MKILVFIIVVILLSQWRKMGCFWKTIFVFTLIYLISNINNKPSKSPIWFDCPAERWEESVPLGNGRIGMMLYGGVFEEKIVLNDITMWSGSVADYSNDSALVALPEIRRLLLEGRNYEAQNLMYEKFTCGNNGSNYGAGADATYGCYQMLANMHLKFFYKEKDKNNNNVTNYRRELDIDNAVAKTTFSYDGVDYEREYFTSMSDDVAVIRLSADKNNCISFEACLDRIERASFNTLDDAIVMTGQLNDGRNGDDGVRFMSKLMVKKKGGDLHFADNKIVVRNASEVMLVLSTCTDFYDDDYQSFVDDKLEYAMGVSWNKLLRNHVKKYKDYYDRVGLTLGESRKEALTIDEQLEDYQYDEDPYLAALYFNYGRYLFISSTRAGCLPPNLQGLWANTVQTPWNGDYHININLQMNHWLAETCNLPELTEPLINMTKGMVESGEKTAKSFYGADGWVAHMMTNPWCFTAPGEHPSWGATNTGGAWLCQHLWKHYLYSLDKDYLRDIYPVLRGSAQFFHSMMIEEPSHGWLVTAPTSSPENAFFDAKGHHIYVCMGSTMDIQIITELFLNVIEANRILGLDDAFADVLSSDLKRLPPMQVSDEGYLQEWLEDYKETDVHHRHVSHLYGLHPASLITKTKTPELFEACKKTLDRRGDEGTGWSRAWKINFWARLHDGDRANLLLKNLLQPAFYGDAVRAGSYPNMFCAHPPFQIEGNLGGAAGIAEMLLQSHDGFIDVLPALPSSWKSGSFKGLCTEGGAVIDCTWENGIVQSLKVFSKTGGDYLINIPSADEMISVSLKKGKSKSINF
ncbi:MAG: glycoside hydrolase family 95 protein [Bacteroidales bacterium]|nr:glycoside hydrolase family 95 protein [Bacteroidales bacterium]